MKKIMLLLIALFILPNILAINLEVQKISSNEIMVLGLNQPTIFDFNITNKGPSSDFLFYSFFGFQVQPNKQIHIDKGETKQVKIQLLPTYNINQGHSLFNYFIKDTKSNSEMNTTLEVKVVNLKDCFEVGSTEMHPELNSLKVYIKNKVNFNFSDIDATFSSPFFNFEKKFSLMPDEQKDFEVKLNSEDFKKLMAGFYTMNANIKIDNASTDVQGVIKFVEANIVNTTEKRSGFFVHKQIIEKINNGNTIAFSEIVIKKGIISRLFTHFNIEPNYAERKGVSVYYTWNKALKPGELLEVKAVTNWFFPFLILILILAVVFFAKIYSTKYLSLNKKISFVRAKGGEFALKVSIFVHANKYIENVSITDRLPNLVKLYERFSEEKPTRINEKMKTIKWNFEKLEEGEVRVLSYIIYSKVGVLGKFALPSARAIYEREGKIHETESNKTFFMAEQADKED